MVDKVDGGTAVGIKQLPKLLVQHWPNENGQTVGLFPLLALFVLRLPNNIGADRGVLNVKATSIPKTITTRCLLNDKSLFPSILQLW